MNLRINIDEIKIKSKHSIILNLHKLPSKKAVNNLWVQVMGDDKCNIQENIDYCGQYGTCLATGTGQIKCICEPFRRGAQCQDFDYESFFKKTYARVFGEETWEKMPSTGWFSRMSYFRGSTGVQQGFNRGSTGVQAWFYAFSWHFHETTLYPTIFSRFFLRTNFHDAVRTELFHLPKARNDCANREQPKNLDFE